MTCWKGISGAWGSGALHIVGGPDRNIYVLSDDGTIGIFNAKTGDTFELDAFPHFTATSFLVGAAVSDSDPDTVYYCDFDLTGQELRKTVRGGSDSSIGHLAFSGFDMEVRQIVWLPGVGLVGFAQDASFPFTHIGLYAINSSTAAMSLLIAGASPNGDYRLVTSDEVLWWLSFSGDLHAYDGTTHYTYTTGAPFRSLLTFNPDDPTQALVDVAAGAGPRDLRFFACSGGISEVGVSSCSSLMNDGRVPVWTFDYSAADNFGDGGTTQLWRFQPNFNNVVWAIRPTSDGNEYWESDGSYVSGVIIPPDPSTFWYAGGSDGRFNYMATVDQSSPFQWHIDKFDGGFETLLDQWSIIGWTDPDHPAFSDIQHLSASPSRIVVIAEKFSGATRVSIGTAVFDTAGTLLDEWNALSGTRTLSSFTGSFATDADVYFGVVDPIGGEAIHSVELSSGTMTSGPSIADIDTAIIALDGSWGGLSECHGIVYIGGDLIVAGVAGIARIEYPSGTPVWWQPFRSGGAFAYYGLALSGHGSVWACDDDLNADEYLYDGTFVQTIVLTEVGQQAWLLKAPGGWSVGQVRH